MEFGECALDFDIIDVAERSPLSCYFDGHQEQRSLEEGLRTSKSWCGPVNNLIGNGLNQHNVIFSAKNMCIYEHRVATEFVNLIYYLGPASLIGIIIQLYKIHKIGK